jgi:hypothetical protein
VHGNAGTSFLHVRSESFHGTPTPQSCKELLSKSALRKAVAASKVLRPQPALGLLGSFTSARVEVHSFVNTPGTPSCLVFR